MIQNVTTWQMNSAVVGMVSNKPRSLHPPRKVDHGPKFLLQYIFIVGRAAQLLWSVILEQSKLCVGSPKKNYNQSASSRNLTVSRVPMLDGVWDGVKFPEPSFDMCKFLKRKKPELLMLRKPKAFLVLSIQLFMIYCNNEDTHCIHLF